MSAQDVTEDQVVAFHEAAHAVLAIELGLGILDVGIDLARVDATGGIGNIGCRLFVADLKDIAPRDLEAEQRRLMGQIDCNGTVLAAGPASDAKLHAEDPWVALHRQKRDLDNMRDLLHRAQLDSNAEAVDERLRVQLAMAVDALNDPAIWASIEAVARAVLEKGPLSGPQIAAIAEPMLEALPTAKVS